jgi:hypothetical protein
MIQQGMAASIGTRRFPPGQVNGTCKSLPVKEPEKQSMSRDTPFQPRRFAGFDIRPIFPCIHSTPAQPSEPNTKDITSIKNVYKFL